MSQSIAQKIESKYNGENLAEVSSECCDAAVGELVKDGDFETFTFSDNSLLVMETTDEGTDITTTTPS